MTGAVLIASVLLTIVFVVAGLAKLADLPGSQQALRAFGVPGVLARPLGVLLPLAELAVAITLFLAHLVWWGALGAFALLLLFSGGIGYNLWRGRRPDCHCFGQLHSAPAGWSTLLRNLLLAGAAGFIVSFGRSPTVLSPLAWLDTLPVDQRIALLIGLLVCALLFCEGWLLVQVLHQQGRLLLRIEALEAQALPPVAPTEPPHAPSPVAGLPVGAPAPAFRLAGLAGETITLDSLRARGKPTFLLFSDPGCGPCTALLPEVGRWQHDYAEQVTLALISRGSSEANRSKASEHGLTEVLLQHDREVATAYHAAGTPSVVLIHSDGLIGSPVALGAEAIGRLIASVVVQSVQPEQPLAAAHSRDKGAAVAP